MIHPGFSGAQFRGVEWRTSSYSNGNGNCVQVAPGAGPMLDPASRSSALVGVRDSKAPDDGMLALRPASWAAFVTAVARGEFTR